ncbi:hypothetical protein [Sphingorhabdus sp.]|jgi:hypothetical protein|uniref:hypothetical protein n=1 Tax=Sphingorhabdus sp. TaxID=1902408 RepID=UPI003BB10B91|nr:hypothetical protein [Sphingomonadales bacterium]MBK9431653.1 hypothetical protein [Sphingomonadales bacterium]MBL0023052.1 hypothetical protein [Sphingomonadales bacterium]
MEESKFEKTFWWFWLAGLLLLALQIFLNVWLSNPISPMGIGDHQSAGTAIRVDQIHLGWKAAGVLDLARISMVIDLIFIGTYAFGAWQGGRAMRAEGTYVLSALGGLIMAAAVVFLLTDYTETICQFIQVMFDQGDNLLADTAATVKPFKTVAFLVTFIGLLVALLFRRMARQAG